VSETPETPDTPETPLEATEEEAEATLEAAEAEGEETPAVAPPEAEAAGDAAEASKVDLSDERPAPPARAKDPDESTGPVPEVKPLGHGPTDAEASLAAAAGTTDEEIEDRPRVRPEIPGADLEPDIVLEEEREASQYSEDVSYDEDGSGDEEAEEEQRIAQATIDLAAGARYPSRGYVVGKRKSAVARVYLKPGNGDFTLTCPEGKRRDRSLDDYFPRPTLQRTIRQPLETVGYETRMDVVARIHGGGMSSQAGALRHGIARALLEADPNLRGELKRRGFLTRDARVKERKKAGLKKARKRPQFSKR
jgi:small subunit ribosomal protein S9